MQSGKLGNGSRVESFLRAFLSPTDVPVLLLNQPVVSWHKKDCCASPHKTLLVKQCNAANPTVYWHVIFILTVIVMITLLLLGNNQSFIKPRTSLYRGSSECKKVVSDSPGLVDFAIGVVNSVFNLPDGQVLFLSNSNKGRTVKSILLVKKLLGLVQMTSGLVNASFSLPEWQVVKMIFFAPCSLYL